MSSREVFEEVVCKIQQVSHWGESWTAPGHRPTAPRRNVSGEAGPPPSAGPDSPCLLAPEGRPHTLSGAQRTQAETVPSFVPSPHSLSCWSLRPKAKELGLFLSSVCLSLSSEERICENNHFPSGQHNAWCTLAMSLIQFMNCDTHQSVDNMRKITQQQHEALHAVIIISTIHVTRNGAKNEQDLCNLLVLCLSQKTPHLCQRKEGRRKEVQTKGREREDE